ncbi:hypothetical protein [Paenarthrobacter sp. 4246]|uniref:hypothetical protein n=1 Tax=Paenarthrobacter sp. 4246 TaxID=3156456 RepID=UPI003399BC40
MKNGFLGMVAAIFATGLLLSGCSGPSSTGLQALERAEAGTDSLPADVDLHETDLDKVLLAAESNGKKYFLGQDNQRRNTCLVAVTTDPHSWHAGCTDSTQGEMLRISGPDQKSAVLVSDGYDTKQLEASGLTKIHPNILVVTN